MKTNLEPTVVVYINSKIACPYCVTAKKTLTERGYVFEERDIAELEVKATLLEKRPTAKTVPQIFLMNGYYIGGCDDLLKVIDHLGLLIELNS